MLSPFRRPAGVSTVITECCRRSVHCRSGWSVAMNHDRSYRHHWFYSIDHLRGRRGIRYSFGCFSRIKKMLGRIETRTRDRIYTVRRYEQLETFPETIKLRPAVCEHRQTIQVLHMLVLLLLKMTFKNNDHHANPDSQPPHIIIIPGYMQSDHL